MDLAEFAQAKYSINGDIVAGEIPKSMTSLLGLALECGCKSKRSNQAENL